MTTPGNTSVEPGSSSTGGTAPHHGRDDRNGRNGRNGSVRDAAGAKERIMRSAYEQFSRSGTRAVGVDAIIAGADVAKMTLYRNFASKDDLILAYLERREQLWVREWLQAEVLHRAATATERLLTIFDVFGEWFPTDRFDGCAFIRVLLEYEDVDGPVRDATVRHLRNIREFLVGLATDAGIADPEPFARQWHILMKGAIIAALEGDHAAAYRSRELGVLLLRSHGFDV